MKFEARRTIRALPEIVKREVRKEEAKAEKASCFSKTGKKIYQSISCFCGS
jgi:hypothetical protein